MSRPRHRPEFHALMAWKQPARVATTANVTISTALNAGDTIDDVTLVAGDRVLVKDQSTASQNGIYVAGTSPARAHDMNLGAEVPGAMVSVIAGTANGGTLWRNTNTSIPTIDSTSLTWEEVAAAGGGGGGATEDTSASGDTTIVNANTFYDGVSESFAAGTWLVVWKVIVGVIVTTSQSYEWAAKLWDGTNVYDESTTGVTITANLNGESWAMGGAALVTLGSTTTLKISCACIRGSSATTIRRNTTVNSATSNKPTRITAYQVA